MSVLIGVDSRVYKREIAETIGFNDLKEAKRSIALRRFKFKPASIDSKPVKSTKVVPVQWILPSTRAQAVR